MFIKSYHSTHNSAEDPFLECIAEQRKRANMDKDKQFLKCVEMILDGQLKFAEIRLIRLVKEFECSAVVKIMTEPGKAL